MLVTVGKRAKRKLLAAQGQETTASASLSSTRSQMLTTILSGPPTSSCLYGRELLTPQTSIA